MNLAAIAKNLYFEYGIWFSSGRNKISYPEEGNSAFFALEESSFWFKHRNNCIASLVKKFSPDLLFYDIGGGNGFVSRWLEKSGVDTVLIEPGIQGCINAQKRGLKNIVCSSLEDAGFVSGSIDSCGLFDVVEHIKDDAAFISNIYKYLKPGGYCFVTVPAYKMLWSNEDVDAGHYKRYNMAGIKQLHIDNGFKIVYASYFFSFLVLPIFLLRSIPSLWKKSSSAFDLQQKEHISSGFSKLIIDQLCSIELNRIIHNKNILFGSSLLVVAQKPH